MILRMESSLTRTLTRERPCYGTASTRDGIVALQRRRSDRTREVVAAVVEVSKEAQEGIIGIRPQIMPPGWSTSKKPIAVAIRYRQRKERPFQRI
jgi:hypothetical protein